MEFYCSPGIQTGPCPLSGIILMLLSLPFSFAFRSLIFAGKEECKLCMTASRDRAGRCGLRTVQGSIVEFVGFMDRVSVVSEGI